MLRFLSLEKLLYQNQATDPAMSNISVLTSRQSSWCLKQGQVGGFPSPAYLTEEERVSLGRYLQEARLVCRSSGPPSPPSGRSAGGWGSESGTACTPGTCSARLCISSCFYLIRVWHAAALRQRHLPSEHPSTRVARDQTWNPLLCRPSLCSRAKL